MGSPFDWKLYRQWLDRALEEFNAEREGFLVCEPRPYHQYSVPEEYEPGDLVEIAENGDAYPHGIGGTNHIPADRSGITPWEEFAQHN